MSRHRYQCHVRFSDVDVYGHVNNVKYLEYYQEARLAFVHEGRRGEVEDPMGLVVARLDVDYRQPILFRAEPYVVSTWVSRVGTSSFGLSCQIEDGPAEEDGQRVLSRAEVVMVAFDRDAQRSRALTDRERSWLRSWLE